jgi:hypothetical protein
MRWADNRDDCGGVLSPDVDGLRVLHNVKTKQNIPWQKTTPEKGDIIVGRFAFDEDGFVMAGHWLDEHLHDPAVRHIILDEVGTLELDGKGWGSWLHSALPQLGEKTLVLVVRRALLDDIINLYGMEEVSVVEKSFFSTP